MTPRLGDGDVFKYVGIDAEFVVDAHVERPATSS